MKDELKLVVEHAMKELRVLLKPDELQHYEELYKAFKSSSSDEARRAAAFEILKRHLSEVGMAAKKTTKEGAKEKRVKDTRKKANEEAMLEQKAKEVLDFYRLIRQQFGLERFDGVTIDLHMRKQAVVFDPKSETLTTVENGELTQFLKSLNVHKVLVDSLFPSNAEILTEISNAGMEVYFLRRTSAPKQFKEFIKRKAEKLKLEIAIPKKNDYVDAVLLSLIKPKFIQKVDADYLTCWQKMVDWRNVNEASMYLQKNFKRKTKLANLLKEAAQLEEETAREFVDTVTAYFPRVEEHFKKLGITGDVVTKAYYCEVFLEMLPCEKFHQVLKKAGIDVSQKAHLKKLEQRKQKKEQRDGEESKDVKEKTFIYDGKFAYALNQLTLRIRGLSPYNKKHKQIIPIATILLAKEIWLMANAEKGDGRVGEALGWRAGPSRKREGLSEMIPALRGRGFLLKLIRPRSKAPNTRPTDHHSQLLTHPFSPLILTISPRLWAPHDLLFACAISLQNAQHKYFSWEGASAGQPLHFLKSATVPKPLDLSSSTSSSRTFRTA